MAHAYTARGNKRYRNYVCVHAQKRGWDTCPTKSVPAGEIERFVVDQTRAVGRDPGLVADMLRHAQRQQKESLERLEAERRVLDRELAPPRSERVSHVGEGFRRSRRC